MRSPVCRSSMLSLSSMRRDTFTSFSRRGQEEEGRRRRGRRARKRRRRARAGRKDGKRAWKAGGKEAER